MNSTFKQHGAFYWSYLSFLILFLPVILFIPKGDLHIFINTYHSGTADIFFKYFTYLGDGMAPVVLSLLFLVFSFRFSFLIASSGLLAGLLAQIFKRLVFAHVVRPIKFFEGIYDLHLVDGVDVHSSFSFPSGHAATIFALCLCLVYFIKSNTVKQVLFFVAVFVAFSRVYLSQHFFTDIYAGSILGIISVLIMYRFISRIKTDWLDKNILSVFKKAD